MLGREVCVMLIHLDVERLARQLKEKGNKSRWRHDAYDAILNEISVLEANMRIQRTELLRHYFAYCGVALVFARHTHDLLHRERLRDKVRQAIDVLRWLERVMIDPKKVARVIPVRIQMQDMLKEYDASLK
jgi:hypothetical protein